MPITKIRTFAGRVGIGISNPSERLEIVGNVKTTGIKIGTNLNAYVPQGAILMWSGSIATIPSGWALCNGDGVTPDLRNKFVLSSGATYSIGDTGGSTTKTMASTNIPSHSHEGSTGSAGLHKHTVSIQNAGSHLHPTSTAQAGSHLHPVVNGAAGSHLHPMTESSIPIHAHPATTSGNGQHTHVSTNRVLLRVDCEFTSRSTDWTPGEVDEVGSYQYFRNQSHTHPGGSVSNSSHTHTWSTQSSGLHNHTNGLNDTVGHVHPVSLTDATSHFHNAATGSAGLHNHSFDTDSTGQGTTFSTLPTYYALAFIMKL